jgi:hypothetical protein
MNSLVRDTDYLSKWDPVLRREVESLLSEPTGGEFLERLAIRNASHLLEDLTLTGLASGVYLGPYRIESKLGEGRMRSVGRDEVPRRGEVDPFPCAN